MSFGTSIDVVGSRRPSRMSVVTRRSQGDKTYFPLNDNDDDGHLYEDAFIAVLVLLILVSLTSAYCFFFRKNKEDGLVSSTSHSVTTWA